MRLFLAVAVLMLAFVAYTEAEEDTFQQKFSRFTDKLSEIGRQVTDQARSTYETIRDSETVAKSRDRFNDWVQRMRDNFSK